VVYRDVTRQAKGLHRLKYVGALSNGLAYLSWYNSGWFCHNNPQQNGIAERKNRTLIEAARTMLDEYKTSDQFWAEAVNTACHAINHLYLHKILKKTTYKLLTSKKSNVLL
jgi:hypothetical protein